MFKLEAISRRFQPCECKACKYSFGILENWYMLCCEGQRAVLCLKCLSKGKRSMMFPATVAGDPEQN